MEIISATAHYKGGQIYHLNTNPRLFLERMAGDPDGAISDVVLEIKTDLGSIVSINYRENIINISINGKPV